MRVLPIISWLLAGLGACQSENKPATPSATVQVHDDLGRALTLPAHPRRVLALAPSLTEMLYAVADKATIIARTQADDYPAAALRKPLVNSCPLDMERLVALRPDVVFTVEGMTPSDAAARLGQLGIRSITRNTGAWPTCRVASTTWAGCWAARLRRAASLIRCKRS